MFFPILALQAVGDAGFQVVADDQLADPAQGLVDGRDLGQDIEAVLLFLDHFAQAAELAFDNCQPSPGAFLDFFVNGHWGSLRLRVRR